MMMFRREPVGAAVSDWALGTDHAPADGSEDRRLSGAEQPRLPFRC
jgi:hypothetical protein